ILAARGASQLAIRALQRSLERLTSASRASKSGPEGREAALRHAWLDGLPEGASFVRRLAQRYSFPCPVMGDNLAVLVRQIRQTLGQAHYRSGNYTEAVRCYTEVLGETPPTASLLSGLGRALARQGRYEEGYTHLRAAHDQES